MKERVKHIIAQLIIVAMISITSITAYHFWWRHKWHKMWLGHHGMFKTDLERLSVPVSTDPHQALIDWANVGINAVEKGTPLALGAMTLWMEDHRRKMKRKS